MKALFLDRDGTLIVDKVYLANPDEVELIAGAAAGLARARALGYRLFLFTNQSGIGRGYHTLEDSQRVNARMEEMLGLPLPVFEEVCVAPEAPGQPVVYRKPSPRFILEAMERHGLDRAQCWMVGDSAADVGSAAAAGIRAALVRSGRVSPDTLASATAQNVPVFDTFADFAKTLA
jgi:D-glycero-D-manno-heptose 1,7-bisphosphate phosphatase